jgi:ketosteroid isomerase-like protein
MVERWNSGDFEAIWATFDPDIVIRPDPDWPEGVCLGTEAAQRFWLSQREAMGLGRLSIEAEHDLGAACVVRINQPVHSRSGFESAYSWSLVVTVRDGRAVMAEFFIDAERARRVLGLTVDG